MALFQQSTKVVSAAIREIADTVGASADSEMVTRAWRSLNAAVGHFNNRANWDFTLTDAPVINVIKPYTLTATANLSPSSSITVPPSHGIEPWDVLLGNYLTVGTRASATGSMGITIGLTAPTTGLAGSATSLITVIRDLYSVPNDFKQMYSVRLNNSAVWLPQIDQRFADRTVETEYSSASQPYAYDLFRIGSNGKIKLLPPPGVADTLQMRYYRNIASASASSDGTLLDIPANYEPYLMAWAKWHFLVDKAEGRGNQLTLWFQLGETGLAAMLKEQTRRPDMDLRFIPGQFSYGVLNDNQTRLLEWNYS